MVGRLPSQYVLSGAEAAFPPFNTHEVVPFDLDNTVTILLPEKAMVGSFGLTLERRSRRFHSDLDHFQEAIDRHRRAVICCMPEVRACNDGRPG
jgi:hypothetical protein